MRRAVCQQQLSLLLSNVMEYGFLTLTKTPASLQDLSGRQITVGGSTTLSWFKSSVMATNGDEWNNNF